MNLIKLVPIYLSLLIMAAHLWRLGLFPLGLALLFAPLLLLLKKPWVARFFQVAMLIIMAEWLHTTWRYVQLRQQMNQPWHRLLLILGVVALLSGLSALVFRPDSLRRAYGLDQGRQQKEKE